MSNIKRKAVSKEYLKRITKGYCIAMAEQAPDTFDRNIMYPDSFIQKMKDTFKKYRRYEFIQTTKKCIAAVFAALVVGSGVWLTIDVDARASMFEWIRQIYENSIVYKYIGEREVDILPEYELHYIPDGFTKAEEHKSEKQCVVLYFNDKTNKSIIFEYCLIDRSSVTSLQNAKANSDYEKLSIGNYNADFYYANASSDANSIVWFDDENGLMFRIDSNMDKQVILDIFESVTLVNPTK